MLNGGFFGTGGKAGVCSARTLVGQKEAGPPAPLPLPLLPLDEGWAPCRAASPPLGLTEWGPAQGLEAAQPVRSCPCAGLGLRVVGYV